MPQQLNDCSEMGMGRNGKNLVGIPWKWELVKNWKWKWEGMGIDCMGMEGNRNAKSHSRSSLVCTSDGLRQKGEGRGYPRAFPLPSSAPSKTFDGDKVPFGVNY